MARIPPHAVIDDFLSADLHDELFEHALGQEHGLTRSSVRSYGARTESVDRRSWVTRQPFGEIEDRFRAAVLDVMPGLVSRLGMQDFEPHRVEIELGVHRDGDYFRPHVDTFSGANRDGLRSDRVITTVYYLHTQPRGYTGGEFAIYPFGDGEPVIVDPLDNRLLAIPAFARHEVRPVSCQPDEFRCARFAFTAWIRRARAGVPS